MELIRRHRYEAGKVGPVIKGSSGSELVDELVVEEGDYKLVKTRFSAFFATNFHSLLTTNGIHSLVVTGSFLFSSDGFYGFVKFFWFFFDIFLCVC